MTSYEFRLTAGVIVGMAAIIWFLRNEKHADDHPLTPVEIRLLIVVFVIALTVAYIIEQHSP